MAKSKEPSVKSEAQPETAQPKIEAAEQSRSVLFELKPGSPRVTRISHGEYTFDFADKEPPYEATAAEWEAYIRPTGLFREAGADLKSARAKKE